MLSTGQLVRETVLMGTLNVGLPTVDVYTDGVQIFKFYRGYAYHPSCWPMDEHNFTIFNETCFGQMPREEVEYENHPIWATMLLVPFLHLSSILPLVSTCHCCQFFGVPE